MPILNAVIHQIDKKPDGSPAVLHLANDKLPDSQAMDNLLFDLNGNYNAKQGKAWGYFQGESGAYPFSGWLSKFTADELDFVEFTRTAAEHLTKLLEESNLSTGGHVLFAHFRQGMTDYLSIAILQQVEAVAVASDLTVAVSRHLDASALSFAARINLSEWKNNLASRQYISFIKPKGARRATAYFRDFIGVTEGIDAAGETRTLLKAFSDFVESEDLAEDDARERTRTSRPTSPSSSGTRTTACRRRFPRTRRRSTTSGDSPAGLRVCRSASSSTCWATKSSSTPMPAACC